ncbi:hypothetical protein CHUAL_000515 [Chamberlinius hualienensis]
MNSTADKVIKRQRKPAVPIYRPPTFSHLETSIPSAEHCQSRVDYFFLEVEDVNKQLHHFRVFKKDTMEEVVERMSKLCNFNQQYRKALEKRLQSEFNRFYKKS